MRSFSPFKSPAWTNTNLVKNPCRRDMLIDGIRWERSICSRSSFLIPITRSSCRILKTFTTPQILENTTLPSFFQFEVQCHRWIPLTFCFILFQLGVRFIIHHYALFRIFTRCLIGHIRPFCALATRLAREQENIIVTFIVTPHLLDKTKTEVSRQFLDEPSESSKALQRIR